MDTGHPIRDVRTLDIPRTAAAFRYFGGIADKVEGTVVPVDAGFLNYVKREPIGVVGAIVPWNFPLLFCSWKMGPALAAGNTIVMKPAEITPLTALRIATLCAKVGFPAGVVNIVPGYGHTAGQHLAEHRGVGKIAFTGSTPVGRKIVQASSGNLKRVQLELGGKGANIVFDDANIDAAVHGSAFAIFHNQGQACIAGFTSPAARGDCRRFLEQFVALARSIKLGNPLDPSTEMGPLTSPQHRDRVLSYVDVAKEQGGTILTGGKPPSDATLAAGCYVEPTVVYGEARRPGVPGRSLRPVRHGHALRRRSRGHRLRQLDDLRAGRRPLDDEPAARASRGRRDAVGHGLDQQLQARAPWVAVRRRG